MRLRQGSPCGSAPLMNYSPWRGSARQCPGSCEPQTLIRRPFLLDLMDLQAAISAIMTHSERGITRLAQLNGRPPKALIAHSASDPFQPSSEKAMNKPNLFRAAIGLAIFGA